MLMMMLTVILKTLKIKLMLFNMSAFRWSGWWFMLKIKLRTTATTADITYGWKTDIHKQTTHNYINKKKKDQIRHHGKKVLCCDICKIIIFMLCNLYGVFYIYNKEYSKQITHWIGTHLKQRKQQRKLKIIK